MGSNPTGIELIFPSFFPSYLSFSFSDLHIFQSTRREIRSETTDNLSEYNPVKNAYRASAHAAHTYPSLHLCYAEKCCWFVMIVLLGKDKYILISRSLHKVCLERNKDVGMGL